MSKLAKPFTYVSGAILGIILMGSLRSCVSNAMSAVSQCEDLQRGAQIELPSGRIMTCQ